VQLDSPKKNPKFVSKGMTQQLKTIDEEGKWGPSQEEIRNQLQREHEEKLSKVTKDFENKFKQQNSKFEVDKKNDQRI
jgi:hypothetical protein